MKESAATPKMNKRVTVEEADNGYIVSCYNEKGNERRTIAQTMKEAHLAMMEMMGEKEKGEYSKLKKKFS